MSCLLLLASCQQQHPGAVASPPLPAKDTLARVQRAFIQAHPIPAPLADFRQDATWPYYSLYSERDIGCDCGVSALALYQSTGQRTITLNQPDETTNWHTFEAYLNHQRIGSAYLDLDNPEESYELDFDTRRLPLPEVELGRLLPDTTRALILVPLEGPRFRQRVQQVLAAESELMGGYPAAFYRNPALLTGKGLFLNQIGHPAEALLFFTAVLAHHPTYAPAYRGRADAHWLRQDYPAALADYRRYAARPAPDPAVPAYVRQVLQAFQH